MVQTKTSKSCEECKLRKVRCEMPADASIWACNNCKKRNVPCHFRPRKKRGRPVGAYISHAPSNVGELPAKIGGPQNPSCSNGIPKQSPTTMTSAGPRMLFVDHLLEDGSNIGIRRNGSSILKADDKYAGSSNIAIFSDRKISSISNRLGHKKFQALFDRLSDSVNARVNRDIRPTDRPMNSEASSASLHIGTDSATVYCAAYFEYVHPIYPFLHRHEFEKNALNGRCSQFCEEDPPFSALYHAVLALGCQRRGGGSFKPGHGPAWQLFQVALDLLPEILTSKETLLHAQAVTAMAIFARNLSCVQIEKSLTTEAARIVQALGINRAMYEGANVDLCRRAFWVVYILEKTQSFACGRDSILIDSNIGTPVPQIPETVFSGWDYFHALCRFSRLLSKAQDALFSMSATLIPPQTMVTAIDSFMLDLEGWKNSINEQFRPGRTLLQVGGVESIPVELKIRISCHYYSAVIALARLKLDLLTEGSTQDRRESEKALIDASRSIIELTRYIDVETYTPIWTLLSVPLSAIFILFDFVIHNPSHTETKSNIALLGVASGYFCRLELSSNGRLQTSHLSELAQIARDYVHDLEARVTGEQTEVSNITLSPHHSQSNEDGTRAQSELPYFTGESSLFGRDPSQAYGATNENIYDPNDTRNFSTESGFQESFDLTRFFVEEISGFNDPCALRERTSADMM